MGLNPFTYPSIFFKKRKEKKEKKRKKKKVDNFLLYNQSQVQVGKLQRKSDGALSHVIREST
jgi:hypothetical protein